ncbi:MAG: T9SS type A sorting domain-containing protein, partial [Crocinitomicaceae bacterium]
ADFHFDLINASPDEVVNFYQTTTDASHFEWTFSEGSAIAESTVPELENNFTDFGPTWVKLVCWSENNCYDSIAKPGPEIFMPLPEIDSCWINANFDVDQVWSGFYVPDIADLALANNGLLTCGTYSDLTFPSRYGSEFTLEGRGGFLSKTDSSGVLKWALHSENEVDPQRYAYMSSTVEDHEGNIYVGGVAIETEEDFQRYIRDNANNRIKSKWRHYLLKLDSRGKLIWSYSIADFRADGLSVDPSNNLYLNLHYEGGDVESGMMIFNETDTVLTSTMTGIIATDKIMKMSPEGEVLWEVEMDNDNTNGGEIQRINFDENENVYVIGNFEYSLTLYSTTGEEEAVVDNLLPGQEGKKGFVLKYDSTGVYQWGLHCETNTESVGSRGEIRDGITDLQGNTYVTGSNSYFLLDEEESFVFVNSNGTITEAEFGDYFVAKINAEGICEWIEGHTYSLSGSGGLAMAFRNNEPIVMGRGINDFSFFQGHFTSSDGSILELPMSINAYFVAEYSTEGVLNKLCVSDTLPTTMYSNNDENLVVGKNGELYLSQNQSISGIEGEVYEQFGTTISNSQGLGHTFGTLLRFDPKCGYCFTPDPGDVQNVNENRRGSFTYYPNPSSGQVFFEFEENAEWEYYRVFDMAGRLIKTERISDLRRLEVTLPNPSGVYLIRLSQSNLSAQSVIVVKY